MSRWKIIPIEELVAPVKSWNPLRENQEETFTYIDLSAVNPATKTITGAREIVCSEAPSRARQLVIAGDVLVATVRPNLNGIAKITAEYDGATVSTGFCVLRPRSDLLFSNYLFHWVKSPEFVTDMVRKATGASYPAVSDRIIRESTIPVPPLVEQRRIAAILDQVDALRAKRRDAIAQLEILTQSIFIEMFGDPATNPKEFPTKLLGEIIKFEGGSQPPASTFTDIETPDTIRLVQIRDFKSDKFKTFIPKKLSRRFFEADDVMIGRYGPPVFQILRGLSGSYNVALMKAVPREGVTKEFVFHLLKEKRLHNFVVANSERTAGQSGVNLELLEKYPAYIPPINSQLEFGKRTSAFRSQAVLMRKSLIEMNALFSSVQHRAFRGEL
jgi:type I restriction enzyme S subunit